jgi:hypothetical protein
MSLRRLPRPRPKRWPRCPECGQRAPTKALLHLHRVRDCCGLAGKRGGT